MKSSHNFLGFLVLKSCRVLLLTLVWFSDVILSTNCQAALVLANGDFSAGVAYNDGTPTLYSDRTVGSTPLGTDWYESDTTTAFSQDSIINTSNTVFNGQYRSASTSGWGNIAQLANTNAFIYQKLGVYSGELSATLDITGYERVLGATNGDFTLQVTLYGENGSFVPGTGVNISTAGLTTLSQQSHLFLFNNNATTFDSENFTYNLGFTGATLGDNIWLELRLITSAGTATASIDNLVLNTVPVPEPTNTALVSLSALAFFLVCRAPHCGKTQHC